MKSNMIKWAGMAVAASVLSVSAVVNYTTVSWDEVLYQTEGADNPDQLNAVVSMGLDGSFLWVKVQNISPDSAGSGAGVEWSGVSFTLPDGVGIRLGGGAFPASGSTLVGGTTAAMLPQWGWDYSASDSLSGGANAYAENDYNATGSTLKSTGPNSFQPHGNTDGMNYGGISIYETGAPGHPYTVDTIELMFSLSGTSIPTDLVAQIDSRPIAVHFGSPNSGYTKVPDGGMTLSLLGIAVCLMAFVRKML